MKMELDAIGRHQEGPLYLQLERMISSAIKAGVYKPGQRIEPESLFMSEGRLSSRTVGRAFKSLAEKGIVVRKRGMGTFVSNERLLDGKGKRIIGVVYTDTHDEFFLPIIQGIEEECRGNNCKVIPISIREGGSASEDAALRRLQDRKVSGVLAIPYVADREHRELIRIIVGHMPVVLMDSYLPDVACDAVVTNNQHGTNELAQHLIGLGHRRIALATVDVKFPYGTAVRDRQVGLAMALGDAGLEFCEELVRTLPMVTASVLTDVRDMVKSLLALPQERRPTAIMCVHDRLARVVIEILKEEGVRLPQEMSVTGFDNLSFASDLEPSLTTYQQPTRRMGRESAKLFFDRLSNPERQPVRIFLDGNIVIRTSTCPPPADGP